MGLVTNQIVNMHNKNVTRRVVSVVASLLVSLVLPSDAFSQDEQEIGRLFDSVVREQFVMLEDDRAAQALAEVGSQLVKATGRSDLGFRFKIINDPVPNAFSSPGGYVYVTTGLLDGLNTREELAAILGPEIAHVLSRHQMSVFESARTKKKWVRRGMYAFQYLALWGGMFAPPLMGMGQLAGAWAGSGISTASLGVLGHALSPLLTSSPGITGTDETDLANQIAALYRQRQQAFGQGRLEDYKRLDDELRKLEQSRDRLVAQIKTIAPQYADVKYPEPVKVPEIPLAPSEVLLRYEVTESRTFAWLVRSGNIVKSVEIPIGREELDGLVRQYAGPFTGIERYSELDRFDPSVGKRLHDLLMEEVLVAVKPQETVVIVPDEVLETLPFEALVTDISPDLTKRAGPYGAYYTGLTYVGDEYATSYYYSATALAKIRTQKKQEKASKTLNASNGFSA